MSVRRNNSTDLRVQKSIKVVKQALKTLIIMTIFIRVICVDGEVKTARKLFYWASVESIAEAKIPNKREVEKIDDDITPIDDGDMPF